MLLPPLIASFEYSGCENCHLRAEIGEARTVVLNLDTVIQNIEDDRLVGRALHALAFQLIHLVLRIPPRLHRVDDLLTQFADDVGHGRRYRVE